MVKFKVTDEDGTLKISAWIDDDESKAVEAKLFISMNPRQLAESLDGSLNLLMNKLKE